MNKPATKEPSMDEILSSIRQIIADDDAAAVAPPPAPIRPAAPPPPAAQERPAASEPLALSASQIVPSYAEPSPASDFEALEGLGDDEADMPAGDPELVDPEDVAFDEPEPPPPPPAPRPAPIPAVQARPAPRPAASVARAAPMPDPRLSADLAEQLLAPTTDAAVTGTMSRLSAMAAPADGGQTIEAMTRDLLRPMLKAWLDENLPALVERVVEKEVARISRGVK